MTIFATAFHPPLHPSRVWHRLHPLPSNTPPSGLPLFCCVTLIPNLFGVKENPQLPAMNGKAKGGSAGLLTCAQRNQGKQHAASPLRCLLGVSGILQLRPVDLICDLRTDANFGGFDNQPFLRQLAT